MTLAIFIGRSLLQWREGDYVGHEHLAGEAERKGMGLRGVVTELCPPHQITLRKSYVLLYPTAKIILINYIKIRTSARNIYSRYSYSNFSTFLVFITHAPKFWPISIHYFPSVCTAFQWPHLILKWNPIHCLKPRGKYDDIISRFLPKMQLDITLFLGILLVNKYWERRNK